LSHLLCLPLRYSGLSACALSIVVAGGVLLVEYHNARSLPCLPTNLDTGLEDTMVDSFNTIYETSQQLDCNFRNAAYVMAIDKIAKVIKGSDTLFSPM
jgi:glutamate dehydrogenase/leucine dehydrogenase